MASSATSQVCSAIQDFYNGAAPIRCYGSIRRFQHQLEMHLNRVTEANFVEQVRIFCKDLLIFMSFEAVSAWARTVLCLISNTAMLVFITVGVWMASDQMISLGLLALIMNSSFTVRIFEIKLFENFIFE